MHEGFKNICCLVFTASSIELANCDVNRLGRTDLMSALLDRCVVTDAQALDIIEEVADEESSVSSQVDRESAGDDVDKHVAVEDSDEEQDSTRESTEASTDLTTNESAEEVSESDDKSEEKASSVWNEGKRGDRRCITLDGVYTNLHMTDEDFGKRVIVTASLTNTTKTGIRERSRGSSDSCAALLTQSDLKFLLPSSSCTTCFRFILYGTFPYSKSFERNCGRLGRTVAKWNHLRMDYCCCKSFSHCILDNSFPPPL